MTTARLDKLAGQIGRPLVPTPAAHLFAGDITVHGADAEMDAALAYIAANFTDAPVYATIGNHDIENDIKTPEEALTYLGVGPRVKTVDLGFVTIVTFYPGDDYATSNSGSRASTTALSALDSALAATSGPVWILCHYPLYNTHVGNVSITWRSIDSAYFCGSLAQTADSSDVEAVIAAYSGVEAWISGHTHTTLDNSTMAVTKTIGGREVACINASTAVPPSKSASWWEAGCTLWLTRTVAGEIEVRGRSFLSSVWLPVNGTSDRVVTLTPG